jgi:putative ABC transport system permease protein
LDAFNQIENTYLSIFLILGGFGLMLGTIGLGIVVVRNIMERRGELALLKAVGFKQGKLQSLILSEHIFLLLTGAGCGFFAALFAVYPAMIAPGTAIPYFTIIITFVLIVMSGLIWTYLATSLATRGNLIPALRNE